MAVLLSMNHHRAARMAHRYIHGDIRSLSEYQNFSFMRLLFLRREEKQVDANEWLIALIICSTCFRHFYAHYQELETIFVLLPRMVCNGVRMKRYN